ncbi:MAG: Fic family protein [Bacilli bacterium]|nr:Fic family protein [Bacilli bacterium]
MENAKLEKALKVQLGKEYYTQKELQYGNSAGVFLSPYEYKEFLDYKDSLALEGHKNIHKLDLKTFNSKCIYYCKGEDLSCLLSSFFNVVIDDYIEHDSFLSKRFDQSIYKSRIYSEIEGTLNVENVPTTRRRLKELLEEDAPIKDTNDVIIKNMAHAMKFVESKPKFCKENLLILYDYLSKDSLEEENRLKQGDYYRYDTVDVGKYHGCPASEIDDCMNSLFNYADNLFKNGGEELFLLPHICHYYILYIHPYFDFNGRTARMVSYWIYLLLEGDYFPPIISEAINQTKSKYYSAIEYTRNNHNDMTYFLKYIFQLTIDYVLCYKNLEIVDRISKNKDIVLTDTELNYLKRIFISYEGKFAYYDFLKYAKVEMSKQGALKILNKFVNCGVLVEVDTPSKNKIFDLNKGVITYRLKFLNSKAYKK